MLAGCTHDAAHSSGQLVARYSGTDAEVSNAPYKATYVLRQSQAPPSDPPPRTWIPEEHVVDLFVRGLSRQQAVGFEKTSDGKLLAIAGDEKIALEPGRYSWHIDPSTEYTGLKWFVHETGERTVEIISLPFDCAAVVVAVPFVLGFFLFTWPFFLCH